MNNDKAEKLTFDDNNKKKLIEFFKYLMQDGSLVSNVYYYGRLVNLLETGARNFPCTGGFRYMHIDLQGNISACPFW